MQGQGKRVESIKLDDQKKQKRNHEFSNKEARVYIP